MSEGYLYNSALATGPNIPRLSKMRIWKTDKDWKGKKQNKNFKCHFKKPKMGVSLIFNSSLTLIFFLSSIIEVWVIIAIEEVFQDVCFL